MRPTYYQIAQPWRRISVALLAFLTPGTFFQAVADKIMYWRGPMTAEKRRGEGVGEKLNAK